MLGVLIKSNVATWNNKNGGKSGRFSEEYPKCWRFYKAMLKPLLYHKRRRFTANTGELKCMAWDVMRKFFLYWSFHTIKKTFVIFPPNAFLTFQSPFHCRYNKLIVFVIVYFLLHCHPYFVFLCVCNVNFEEVF